jgi:dipeptidyl aminopeptidase/acylaminoacyl peptidase
MIACVYKKARGPLSRVRENRLAVAAVAAVCYALWPSGTALAQDGKIVSSSLTVLNGESLKQVEALPSYQTIASAVEVRSITYLSDGLKIKGYLAMPKDGGPYPSVIYNRGGNGDLGALSEVDAVAGLGLIASWGYVVVASQYRGNSGSDAKDEFAGADVDDIMNLFPLLDSLGQADPTRIGVYGWSRGGMMTYIALTRTTRLSAAIIGGGIADLSDTVRRRIAIEQVATALIPNYHEDKVAALKARSAIMWPEQLSKNTPILLLQGGSDWRVDPTQTLRMAAALYEIQHPFRLVFFEGGDHGLDEYQGEASRLVRDWLDYYVRDKRTWPDLRPHGP